MDIGYDELGPQKVIHLYSPKVGLKAIVVIDNTALGPSVGGVRVSKDVTLSEVIRLARTMTLKNSVAGLPHGGAKGAILADPKDPKKEIYFRTFARLIKDITEYIPGPDMGSNEECMAWIYDENSRSAGLPEELGGLPLDRLGATGFGIARCAEVSCPFAGLEVSNSRVAIQGFGSVGKAVGRFLSEMGAKIVAVSDTKGFIYNPSGIDIKKLIQVKESSGSVINYKDGISNPEPDGIFRVECDILIPAATPDVINRENAPEIKARLILQGANIPATLEAEEMLAKRGVLLVPDFIANAGGVIMAAMEWAKKTEKEAFLEIETKIKLNTQLVLERSREKNILPRTAAIEIAKERVLSAMRYRTY